MPSFTTILLPAGDIATSRELYRELLGTDPTVDESYYVGYDVDGQHVGLVPGVTTVRPHLSVDDIDEAVQRVIAAGGSVVDAAKDVGGGRLVAVVRDAAGAEIGFIHDSTRG